MEPEYKPIYESDVLFDGAIEELTNGKERGEDSEQ